MQSAEKIGLGRRKSLFVNLSHVRPYQISFMVLWNALMDSNITQFADFGANQAISQMVPQLELVPWVDLGLGLQLGVFLYPVVSQRNPETEECGAAMKINTPQFVNSSAELVTN